MSLLASTLRPVDLDLTPVEVAARCRHLPGCVFFDTAREGRADGEISVLAAEPTEIVRGRTNADWQRLRAALAARATGGHCDDGLPRGLAAGSVEYDGAFCFGFYDDALLYRHADATWWATEQGHPRPEFQTRGEGRLAPFLPPLFPSDSSAPAPCFAPTMPRDYFCRMVTRAQEYIAAGHIYQVNLAHRFTAPWNGDAFAFYEALRHYSPAPYGAYLDLDGRQILSTSPESFLRMSGRTVRTRPIKGTRPRRADLNADEKSAYDLLTSPKEIAELVMITDLERNDLGQVCEYGSVAVTELLKLERYEQVFHLVSTVDGRLRPEVDHIAALRACFPGGSITGAPKKRAREIIAELEPEPRGLYTGAIGWFGFNGESHFNIAIRTVVAEGDEMHFHVGAGIVADSVPEREWQETLDKAAGILLAAERFGSGR